MMVHGSACCLGAGLQQPSQHPGCWPGEKTGSESPSTGNADAMVSAATQRVAQPTQRWRARESGFPVTHGNRIRQIMQTCKGVTKRATNRKHSRTGRAEGRELAGRLAAVVAGKRTGARAPAHTPAARIALARLEAAARNTPAEPACSCSASGQVPYRDPRHNRPCCTDTTSCLLLSYLPPGREIRQVGTKGVVPQFRVCDLADDREAGTICSTSVTSTTLSN